MEIPSIDFTAQAAHDNLLSDKIGLKRRPEIDILDPPAAFRLEIMRLHLGTILEISLKPGSNASIAVAHREEARGPTDGNLDIVGGLLLTVAATGPKMPRSLWLGCNVFHDDAGDPSNVGL